jgi:hypothetical protein
VSYESLNVVEVGSFQDFFYGDRGGFGGGLGGNSKVGLDGGGRAKVECSSDSEMAV